MVVIMATARTPPLATQRSEKGQKMVRGGPEGLPDFLICLTCLRTAEKCTETCPGACVQPFLDLQTKCLEKKRPDFFRRLLPIWDVTVCSFVPQI